MTSLPPSIRQLFDDETFARSRGGDHYARAVCLLHNIDATSLVISQFHIILHIRIFHATSLGI